MTFSILVPEPMKDEISSWNLSFEAENELYAQLEPGLTQEELDRLHRLAAPSPTFILYVDFQDPVILGIKHSCTFYLTFGDQDNALYIRDGSHTETEDWQDNSDNF